MTIVFMGTPDFAAPTLQALLDNGYDVRAVVTQPDRPKGRGQQMCVSPVKALAMQHQLRVLQPEKVRKDMEFQAILKEIAPDVIVVIAYGQILPESVLQIPRLGCINVHASLLPKYRGAAPMQWAIIRGETETGVTTMMMDKGMDTGDMLLTAHVPVGEDDTAGTLHDTLAQTGAQLLIETLHGIAAGTVARIPQDHALVTYAPLLKKEDGRINWQEHAIAIYNKVRGLSPWPGAYTTFNGMTVKLLQVKVESAPSDMNSMLLGSVIALDKNSGPLILTSEGAIRILKIQPENKQPMNCSDFCRGYRLNIGDRLDT